jgi:hypothetical protein
MTLFIHIRRFRFVLLAAWLVSATAGASRADAQAQNPAAPASAAQPLVLTARSIKIIPPRVDEDETLSITNTGRDKVALSLEAGDLLEGDMPLPGALMLEATPPGTTLPPGQKIQVRIKVVGMTTSGTATVAILNNGTRIGDLVVIRYPVAVTVDEIKPGSVVSVRAGSPIRVTLRNADRTAYDISVGMTVGSQLYCAARADPTKRPVLFCARQALWSQFGWPDNSCQKVEPVKLPARGVAIVSLEPPCGSSSGMVSGLIKNDEGDGTLRVDLAGTDPATKSAFTDPVTQIPFKATVGYAYMGPVGQQIWSTVLIALVLGLGGGCSLLSRYWVPNELARRQLLDELSRVDAVSGPVSGRFGSELSLLMRVEAKRLIDQVRQVLPIRADSEALLAEYRGRLAGLYRRLQQLKALDDAWDSLAELRSACAPPSHVHGVEDTLGRIAQTLRKSELTNLEFERVQADLSAAVDEIRRIDSGDAALSEALHTTLDAQRTALQPTATLWSTDVAKELRGKLPGPFAVLDGGAIEGDSWSDSQIQALTVIRNYIRMHETSTDQTARDRLKAHEPELIRHLSALSIESLRSASRLVREMREGHLCVGSRRRAAPLSGADRGRAEVIPTVPTAASAPRFDRPELNDTAAQSRFRCEWRFGQSDDETSQQTNEEGWEVCHYLTERKPLKVSVSVYNVRPTDESSAPTEAEAKPLDSRVATLETTLTPDIDLSDRRAHRMKAEIIGLGVVLLIALLGLVTGAREQITKLDIVPGLIAVFLLGFSADSIKGALTAKPATPETKHAVTVAL